MTEKPCGNKSKPHINKRRISLIGYDLILLLICDIIFLWLKPSSSAPLSIIPFFYHTLITIACVFFFRFATDVYKQVWRYSGASAYIRLIFADMLAGCAYYLIETILPIQKVAFIRAVSLISINLMLAMSIRLVYLYLYDYCSQHQVNNGFAAKLLSLLTGAAVTNPNEPIEVSADTRIRIAIVGAGRVGVMLAEELMKNPHASYQPCCFIDIDHEKIGREIAGIQVLSETEATAEMIAKYRIQEIVFALPQLSPEKKKSWYETYKKSGCKIKVYDYPVMQTADGGKRHLREFDIEELLFRSPIKINNELTTAYYNGKVVMITGGGGSIGSELCRQIAKMKPKLLVVLDIYENGAYDIQQELRIAYGKQLKLQVEIVSVCDYPGLEKVFAVHKPDIVIHAAAHKHVPLCEHNICEAVKNNVFGTLNTIRLCEKYKVGRFMMVSTDKAVNPTNVMGATKRMCEMIVQSHSRNESGTVYSATRFGNVLGSAGSVIPLFKKQILNGGPVTVTDKRIIRYFMTIPEASQLVLESGAMAKNGELFVLDMGKPVRILELAENMIRLSGFEPYRDINIIETGLRPGEKLYEELLIRTEELDKTENSMIFIERDEPLSLDAIDNKLNILREALVSEDDETVKEALKRVVPTFYSPEELNRDAINAHEMRMLRSANE